MPNKYVTIRFEGVGGVDKPNQEEYDTCIKTQEGTTMTTNGGVVAAKKYWLFILTCTDGKETRSIKGPLYESEARSLADHITHKFGYRSVVWDPA